MILDHILSTRYRNPRCHLVLPEWSRLALILPHVCSMRAHTYKIKRYFAYRRRLQDDQVSPDRHRCDRHPPSPRYICICYLPRANLSVLTQSSPKCTRYAKIDFNKYASISVRLTSPKRINIEYSDLQERIPSREKISTSRSLKRTHSTSRQSRQALRTAS